ncbi:BREX protein BrxB domain-containing protein [Rhodocaloribacter sp.]
MSKLDRLLKRYEATVRLPWKKNLAGAQKVWFLIYDPAEERRLRAHLDEFKLATRRAGHTWILCDLTDSFPRWMAKQEYRTSYFEDPEVASVLPPIYLEALADQVHTALQQADAQTVVAVLGVGTLFGFVRFSDVLERVQKDIRGRMVVFFPGTYHQHTYRLLDAREGWDYLAVPITS